MRRKEERASKIKQTTRQSNTAHPRQSLFLRKMSCFGWDSNPRHSTHMYIQCGLCNSYLYNSPVFPPPSPPTGSAWLLVREQKEVQKYFVVFGVDDRSHLKFPLERVDFFLELVRQFSHLLPFLYLLKELDQAGNE